MTVPTAETAKLLQFLAAEMCPDFQVEHSRQGVEKAMIEGDGRLRNGAFEEAARWYSKGVWLVDSKKITD
eukprot:11097059-Heterocapsa_arctica.AAC.1